jgi:stage II sporulation protein D (peptidoglycan lytic transglycosylase)
VFLLLRLLVIVALMCAPVATGFGRAQSVPRVRVGLALGQDIVSIGTDGPVDIVDIDSGRRDAVEGGRLTARPSAAGIEIAGVSYGTAARIQPRSGYLQVGGRSYRGALEVRRTAQARLTVINDVELEEYVYGVVRSEMDPRWPAEALRAQAVAARSLAMYSVGRFAAEGYDVRATTDSQVYGGVAAEDPRTTAAVDATRGVLVLYDGRAAFAAFHADSGGATESSELVWGGVVPHLRGVPDPYSRDAPNHQWTARTDARTLEQRLQRAGKPVSGLQRLEVLVATPSGRVTTLRATTATGPVDIRGQDLRAALGLSAVRSTLFAIRTVGEGTIEITGRGSGHGVGMSQWGARGLAMAGRDFSEILRYYYTGVTVGPRP